MTAREVFLANGANLVDFESVGAKAVFMRQLRLRAKPMLECKNDYEPPPQFICTDHLRAIIDASS
jgi:hypothetical protein